MSRRSQRSAILIGWIRLIPDGDSYGVPLFKGIGNAPVTAETDDDLAIVSFHEFYNEAGYAISNALPPGHVRYRYKTGDKIPIPLSLEGKVEIIDASITEQDFLATHPRSVGVPAVVAVAHFLQSAAIGTFRARSAERVARRLRLEHDEVLGGEPAHSAYWIQKLGLVAGAVRRLPKNDRGAGQRVLSEKATGWLKRFGTNSDPSMLARLLKVAGDGGGAKDPETQAAVFSTILSRFTSGTQSLKEQATILTAMRTCMPGGLWGHYIENGLPKLLSRQQRDLARDLPRLLLETINDDDAHMTSFGRSLGLAGAIFYDQDLPTEVSEIIGQMAQDRFDQLCDAVSRSTDAYVGRRKLQLTTSDAGKYLEENDRVIVLYRILHGEDRLSYNPRTSSIRFGLGDVDLEMLRSKDSLFYTAYPIEQRARKKKRG